MMASSIALVLRMDVSPAIAPKSAMLNVSGGKEVRVIDCSISAAIFHLSLSVQEARTVTRKMISGGRKRVMVSSRYFLEIKDISSPLRGGIFFW
jgi:hypothetical protein